MHVGCGHKSKFWVKLLKANTVFLVEYKKNAFATLVNQFLTTNASLLAQNIGSDF